MARLPSLKTRPFGYKPTVTEIEPTRERKLFDLGLPERAPFEIPPQTARTTAPVVREFPKYEVRWPYAKEKTFITPGTIHDPLIAVGMRLPEIPPIIMVGAINFFRKNINTILAGKHIQTKQFETALGVDVRRFGLDPDEMMANTIEKGLKQFEVEKQAHPGRSDYLNAGMATAKTIIPDAMDVLIATNIAQGVLKLAAGAVRVSAKQLPDSVLFKIQQQQVNPNAIFDALRGSNLANPKEVKIALKFVKSLTAKERIELYKLARSYETTGLRVPLPGKVEPTFLGRIAGKPAPGVQLPPRIAGLLPGQVRPVAQAGFISPEAMGKDLVNLAKQAKDISVFKKIISKEQLAMIVARGFTPESFFSAVKAPITPKEATPIVQKAIKEAIPTPKGIIPQEKELRQIYKPILLKADKIDVEYVGNCVDIAGGAKFVDTQLDKAITISKKHPIVNKIRDEWAGKGGIGARGRIGNRIDDYDAEVLLNDKYLIFRESSIEYFYKLKGQPKIIETVKGVKEVVEEVPGIPGVPGLRKVGLAPEKPEMITRAETTLLKDRIRTLARGVREGTIATKDQIKETQTELIDIIKASELDLKDQAKFIRTVKNIQTPEQLQKELPTIAERIAKLEEAKEVRTLKSQIGKELKEKFVITDKSGVRLGKATIEAQDKITEIKNIVGMKREMAETEYNALLEAEAFAVEPSVESIARKRLLEYNLFRNDPAVLNNLLKDIQSIKTDGKTEFERLRANRLAEDQRHIDAFVDSIAPSGIKAGTGITSTDLAKEEIKAIRRIKEGIGSIEDYGLAGEFLFDKMERANINTEMLKGPLTKFYRRGITNAENTKNESLMKTRDALQGEIYKLFGLDSPTKVYKVFPGIRKAISRIVSERKFIRKVAEYTTKKESLGVFKDQSGKDFELRFTKDQQMYHWGQQQNPAILPTYKEWGWTDKMIEALDKNLTVKEKGFVRTIGEGEDSFLGRFRAGEFDGVALDPIYEAEYGTRLGTVRDMYIPLSRDVDMPSHVRLIQDKAQILSTKPQAIKSRVANRNPIRVETGLLQTLNRHIYEMSHWKGYGPFVNQFRRVFSKDVKTAINQNFRDSRELIGIMDDLINGLAKDGSKTTKNVSALENLMGRAYTGFIGVNPVSATKQIVSTIAWLGEMPAKRFFTDVPDFWKDPIGKGRFLIKNSTGLVSRADQASWEREAQAAVKRGDTGALASNKTGFARNAMVMTRIVDIRGGILPGAWAKYLEVLETKTGLTAPRRVSELEQFIKKHPKEHEEAILQMQEVYERTQQTGISGKVSHIRRSGSWAKLWTFAQSAPEAQFNNTVSTLRAMGFFGDPKRIPTGKGLKRLVIYLVAIPAMLQFISDGFKVRPIRQVAAVGASILTAGWSNYPVFFGQLIESSARRIAGLPAFDLAEPAALSIINDLFKTGSYSVRKIMDDATIEDIYEVMEDAAVAIGTTAGFPAKVLQRMKDGWLELIEEGEVDIRRLLGWSEWALTEQGAEKEKAQTFPSGALQTRPGIDQRRQGLPSLKTRP